MRRLGRIGAAGLLMALAVLGGWGLHWIGEGTAIAHASEMAAESAAEATADGTKGSSSIGGDGEKAAPTAANRPVKSSGLDWDRYPVRYLINWQLYLGEEPGQDAEWQPLDEAAGKRLAEYEGTLWLKRELPALPPRDPYLFLFEFKHVEVFVDGKSVYEFNMRKPDKYMNPAAALLPVRLSPEDAGKTVAIKLLWDHKPMPSYWNNIGDRFTIFKSMIGRDWKLIVYSVIFLVSGTVSLFMFLRRRQELLYFWFTMLTYCAGIGMITLIISMQWFFPGIYRLYYFRDALLTIGVTANIGFYTVALGKEYQRTYRVLIGVMGAYSAVTVAASFIHPGFYVSLIVQWLPYIMLALFSVMTYTLARYIRHKRTRETFWLGFGYVFLLIFGFLHVLMNYFAFLQDRFQWPRLVLELSPHMLPIGILLFLFSLAMVIFGRFSEVHRQLQRYARELASKNEEMARYDQLKDDFLRNTSHELRTPLHGIAGLTESLLDGAAGPVDGHMKGNLQLILDSSNRLLRLVNDILDLYHMMHRDLKLKPEPVDPRQAAGVVAAALTPLARRKGLATHVGIPANNGLAIYADPNRLEQILYNLIGNAIRYTVEGSITVVAEPAEGGMVTVAVEDTGPGITPERMATLFQPFAAAESSSGGGTGLGLSITKQLVEMQGGTFAIGPRPGGGTRASFTLPAAPASPEESAAEGAAAALTELATLAREPAAVLPLAPAFDDARDDAAAGSESGWNSAVAPDDADAAEERIHAGQEAREIDAATAVEGSSGAPTILLVDDEPINLQVLQHFLRGEPYRLVQAKDGQEALRLLEDGEKLNLVLLDVMMPVLTGYEVCQRIRERWTPNELPIILLSARNRIVDMTQGFDAGANDYLSKPFSQGELLARVHIQLKLAQFHHSLEEQVVLRTRELEEANRILAGSVRETAEALTEVSVLEERNRIAHEMHDVVGHTLTAAIVQLEAAKKLSDRDFGKSVERLDVSKELVRKGLDEIRRAVRMLSDEGAPFDLSTALNELIQDTRDNAGVTIFYKPEPLPPLSGLTQRVIYHALMEGMTNGIRHGRCTTFAFELYAEDGWIYFDLGNDGDPYGTARPGFGLTSMMERVHLLGGSVRIGSRSGEDAGAPEGCRLAIALPLSDER
ncbi:ATP-binding protein [Paenibacillus methanolicus]|uniref:Oxygen sensor histidine kinase NreB n=1 Tax=Paenibacillus methanolicus TaxID=582686 RepID=A0A5S5CJ81_9BACL|nr:ATP-binding protein [Paenibacillus methanolicus]TYP78256.1 two-component system sensor histidine kinase ChiS [Paenibacillus methanolicus]